MGGGIVRQPREDLDAVLGGLGLGQAHVPVHELGHQGVGQDRRRGDLGFVPVVPSPQGGRILGTFY